MAQADFLNDWDNVVSSGRNELVFENKNKSYGAYDLRRNYNNRIIRAVLVTSFAALLIVSIPKIMELLGKATEEEVVVPVDITPMDLEAPPPVDETEPPPPPPPPPPMVETIKFTPPVVVDEEVPDDEIPPPQEVETQVSTVTQEGTGGDEIIIPQENTGGGVIEDPNANQVFTIVEQMPEFAGGDVYSYISKNVKYPAMEKENGISGTVWVSFVVDKDGSIRDIKVERGVKGGPGLEKEAVRVISGMPAWKPGKNNGHPVKVSFTVPIKFALR